MVQAPVGWQCPGCVGAGGGRRSSYRWQPRRAPAGIDWRAGPVTIALVVVNVAAFVASGMGNPAVLDRWGLVPYEVADGQWYRLFTSPFLHVSVAHIGLNMLSLVLVGIPVEAAVGRLRYGALYAASALGGSVLFYLIGPLNEAAVGASGAIFGVFGAYFVIARRRGLRTGGIVALIALNLAFGFAVPGIGWQAHVGGLVAGLAVAGGFMVAEHRPLRQRRAVEVATCVAVAAVLVALMQVAPSGHVVGY